jgi:hypothetical protein
MATNQATTVARARRKRRSIEPHWETIEAAAARLDLDPQALRARCRRAARRGADGDVVAELGMGVVARKLGVTWRVFVPSAST